MSINILFKKKKKKRNDQTAFITIEFNYENAEIIRKVMNSIVLSLTTGEAIIFTSRTLNSSFNLLRITVL